MLQNQFKHLPVLDIHGQVSGMLDISKCLHDAISVMERAQASADAFASELQRVSGFSVAGHQDTASKWIEAMRRPTVAMAVEKNMPPPLVGVETPVREAAKMMGSSRTAAVVLDGRDVIGMVTPKDLLRKLIARSLSAETTRVGDVMTVHPVTMPPTASILEGLHVMKESRELFVPIVEIASGHVMGMADVLCLSYSQFGDDKSEWRTFWQSAIAMQEEMGGNSKINDDSNIDDGTCSVGTIEDFERSEMNNIPESKMKIQKSNSIYSELGDSVSVVSADHNTTISSMTGRSSSFLFKVKDPQSGHVHRIRSSVDSLEALQFEIRQKMNLSSQTKLLLKYEDDEGDIAVISSDTSMMEAVNMAQELKWKSLMLVVDINHTSNVEKVPIVYEGRPEFQIKAANANTVPPVTAADELNQEAAAGKDSNQVNVFIGLGIVIGIFGVIAIGVMRQK
jgi:CBS domain-containing protein